MLVESTLVLGKPQPGGEVAGEHDMEDKEGGKLNFKVCIVRCRDGRDGICLCVRLEDLAEDVG